MFDEIAEAGIVVDMIVQSIGRDGRANSPFTVPRGDSRRALDSGRANWPRRSAARRRRSCPPVAKLSVLGVGMRSHTGVASRMFQSLADAGINVEMISTSEVRVNVVVDGRDGEKALAALGNEFADAMV